MVLAVVNRGNPDERSMGEMLFLLSDEVSDLTFEEAWMRLVGQIIETDLELCKNMDEDAVGLLVNFLNSLPRDLKSPLLNAAL